jgi:hypothetical protein
MKADQLFGLPIIRSGVGCRQIRLGWGTKLMERFGNSALQTLAFSLQPLDLVLVIGKFGGADQLPSPI